ncbi:MAG TPA: aromatic ring-hydroxylating dioxygenase subunit alpha [Solirubrobacterales bacterium]|jgi:phenylpropionate dioxygenase-like ring-hydroxylating dioxygenase large terminal subunit
MSTMDSLVREKNGNFTVGRRAWFDGEVHREELKKIFSKAWLFVGHESEIPEPGDYVTRRLGIEPVVMTRDKEGQVRIVGNTCRHRGIRLCRADRGNSSHFRCPYHGWTYASNGDLTGVTNVREIFDASFDKKRFPLYTPAQIDSVFGLVFATWDPEAPSLQEFLGDALWYLGSIFGAFDGGVEVLGSPVRTKMQTNWKLESENLSGDGYHTPITHQSAFVLGMFAGPDDWERMGDVVAKKFRGRVVDAGNGHTFRVHHLPIAADPPNFHGFPEELWPEIERNLDAGQIDVQSRLSIIHGNIFPNLTVMENFKTSTESKGSATRYLRLTVQYPLGPYEDEMLWWNLAPAHSDEEWRQQSSRAYLRTNGPTGMLQVDDNENFAGFADSHSGEVLREGEIVLEAGMNDTIDEPGWRGTVYDADKTEQTMRAFWRQWASYMEDDTVTSTPS